MGQFPKARTASREIWRDRFFMEGKDATFTGQKTSARQSLQRGPEEKHTPPPPPRCSGEGKAEARRPGAGSLPAWQGSTAGSRAGRDTPLADLPILAAGARSAWARNGARRLLSPARRLRGWGGGASPAPPFPSAGGGVPSELGGPAGFGALGGLSPPLLCGWPRPSRCEGTPRRWR